MGREEAPVTPGPAGERSETAQRTTGRRSSSCFRRTARFCSKSSESGSLWGCSHQGKVQEMLASGSGSLWVGDVGEVGGLMSSTSPDPAEQPQQEASWGAELSRRR